MKKIVIAIIFLAMGSTAFAGNPDRIGQAGATQLNVNGWGRSSGWGWAGVSSAVGLEAMYLNIGGLAHTENTEFIFSRTSWLRGTDINVNSFGFSQNLGGIGVLGIYVTSFDIGEIDITTYEQPDGNIGTYKPNLTNIGLAYSKKFTRTISGGLGLKVFSESITNAKAQGVALDAGLQYITSSNPDDKQKSNDVKFGVSLKNVGPDATYGGDGLAYKVTFQDKPEEERTFEQRAASFNLPTLINIGASYDMRLDKTDETYFHRLTTALNFTNNAFSKNQFTLGLEYGYKDMFMLRTGYAYEDGIMNYETRTNAYTGLMAGFTFEVPIKKGSNTTFGLDYSFRHSNPFSGTHSFGVRLNIGSND